MIGRHLLASSALNPLPGFEFLLSFISFLCLVQTFLSDCIFSVLYRKVATNLCKMNILPQHIPPLLHLPLHIFRMISCIHRFINIYCIFHFLTWMFQIILKYSGEEILNPSLFQYNEGKSVGIGIYNDSRVSFLLIKCNAQISRNDIPRTWPQCPQSQLQSGLCYVFCYFSAHILLFCMVGREEQPSSK